MRYLGWIKDISKKGYLIAKADFAPAVGDQVWEGRRTIGKVVNVFGPVSSPYVSIKATRTDGLLGLVGRKVYVK